MQATCTYPPVFLSDRLKCPVLLLPKEQWNTVWLFAKLLSLTLCSIETGGFIVAPCPERSTGDFQGAWSVTFTRNKNIAKTPYFSLFYRLDVDYETATYIAYGLLKQVPSPGALFTVEHFVLYSVR